MPWSTFPKCGAMLTSQCQGSRAIQLEDRCPVYSRRDEDSIPTTSILGKPICRGQAQGDVSDSSTTLWEWADVRPPVRPLFFEFDDPEYFAVEEQFMVGSSLLITPVLHEGKATVTGYFPSSGGTTWRDWTTGEVSRARSFLSTTLLYY